MGSTSNVGIAFGAVFAAGGSTAVGAAIVFFPWLVKLASRRVLASSLGISAGVMTYVSFVEIFQKSVNAFDEMNLLTMEDDDKRFGRANLYATLSFFTGVLIMILIDVTVKCLSKNGSHDHDHHDISDSLRRVENGSIPGREDDGRHKEREEVVVPAVLSCCRPDPVGDLESWQLKATEEEYRNIQYDGSTLFTGINSAQSDREEEEASSESSKENVNQTTVENMANVKPSPKELDEEREQKKLVRMGLQTAIAIGLHNFPEGLATYVSVLNDPKIGAVLAIAIGIHNIPEGFCVALPVYYATGNRRKAFLWGALSGISEPIGAILGYIVLANRFSSVTYGVMFGVVAGMMVMISLKELLPTAYRYDPGDTVVTNSLIFGMAVISLSLVLFYL